MNKKLQESKDFLQENEKSILFLQSSVNAIPKNNLNNQPNTKAKPGEHFLNELSNLYKSSSKTAQIAFKEAESATLSFGIQSSNNPWICWMAQCQLEFKQLCQLQFIIVIQFVVQFLLQITAKAKHHINSFSEILTSFFVPKAA